MIIGIIWTHLDKFGIFQALQRSPTLQTSNFSGTILAIWKFENISFWNFRISITILLQCLATVRYKKATWHIANWQNQRFAFLSLYPPVTKNQTTNILLICCNFTSSSGEAAAETLENIFVSLIQDSKSESLRGRKKHKFLTQDWRAPPNGQPNFEHKGGISTRSR